MRITGDAIIACELTKGAAQGEFQAVNQMEKEKMLPVFSSVSPEQIAAACVLSEDAFDRFRYISDDQRAKFLEAIANNIEALGDELIDRAIKETALSRMRLENERGRTVKQLRLFASLVRDGSWCDARIDNAMPHRVPKRADIRMRLIPIGPVAVFGASNFPLAFSVAGGDTAAAFAAGCTVIAKAHSGHPGTAELVGRAIVAAVEECGLPKGTFSLLSGTGNYIGSTLVAHPSVKAVGFTGSRAGGTSLMAVASARKHPIPVFAEMSSLNPVCILPLALKNRTEEVAEKFVESLTLGVGQFCTNPGLIFVVRDDSLKLFYEKVMNGLDRVSSATMLTAGTSRNYHSAMLHISKQTNVRALYARNQIEGQGAPALFSVDAETFLENLELQTELFGPAALIVECASMEQMYLALEALEGQLTGTIQMDGLEVGARKLISIFERKVGRIIINDFPTGVEVCDAIVHGGPFPATSDGRSTSVGTGSIYRFLRPVAYQNFEQGLLPIHLVDKNPLGIWRKVDGTFTNR